MHYVFSTDIEGPRVGISRGFLTNCYLNGGIQYCSIIGVVDGKWMWLLYLKESSVI